MTLGTQWLSAARYLDQGHALRRSLVTGFVSVRRYSLSRADRHASPAHVIHFSTVHPPFDPRIFDRECRTLRESGYRVEYFSADVPEEDRDGIAIRSLLLSSWLTRALKPITRRTRAGRMAFGWFGVVEVALRRRPAIVHLHDPELLPAALVLRLARKRVIYDAHEDLQRQILNKQYLGLWRHVVAPLAGVTIRVAARCVSGVVVAHDWQADTTPNSTVVRNLPRLEVLSEIAIEKRSNPSLVYVGSITRDRGAVTMLDLMSRLRGQVPSLELVLAGNVHDDLLDELRSHPEWQHVEYHGPVPWQQAMELVASAHVGVFLPHAVPTYLNQEPTKLFEYLALGLQCVVPNFPLYRELVGGRGDVLMASPPDYSDLDGEVISSLRTQSSMRPHTRENSWSWQPEGNRLVELYDQLLGYVSEERNDEFSDVPDLV